MIHVTMSQLEAVLKKSQENKIPLEKAIEHLVDLTKDNEKRYPHLDMKFQKITGVDENKITAKIEVNENIWYSLDILGRMVGQKVRVQMIQEDIETMKEREEEKAKAKQEAESMPIKKDEPSPIIDSEGNLDPALEPGNILTATRDVQVKGQRILEKDQKIEVNVIEDKMISSTDGIEIPKRSFSALVFDPADQIDTDIREEPEKPKIVKLKKSVGLANTPYKKDTQFKIVESKEMEIVIQEIPEAVDGAEHFQGSGQPFTISMITFKPLFI